MVDSITLQRVITLLHGQRLVPAKKVLYEMRAQAWDPAEIVLYNTAIQFINNNNHLDAIVVLQDPARFDVSFVHNVNTHKPACARRLSF